MAMRVLLSACLFGAASAAGIFSEHEFKTRYDTYTKSKDGTAVRTANANIEGSAIPLDAEEVELHRWYHDVDAGVKAAAKAIMDKAHVARPAENFPVASCLADIKAAQDKTAAEKANPTWPEQYKVYNKMLAEKVGAAAAPAAAAPAAAAPAAAAPAAAAPAAAAPAAAAPAAAAWNAEEVKAWNCLHALSGEHKELAIQAGLRSKMMAIFELKAKPAVSGNSMLLVSQFVSGTLAGTASADAKTGKETQPMYSEADAALRRDMMQHMVTLLNAQLQP